MGTSAVFPRTAMRAGMYESFYLRAVAPREPVGVWIRHTVHKRPGAQPLGSVWCTLFDARRGRPFMHKFTTPKLDVPLDAWIAVGEPGAPTGEGATMAPDRAWGTCGPASWQLSWSSREPELRHLPRESLYRAPLPRTKLTSPAPLATFDGEVRVEGSPLELRGWRGVVGHNWGSEHAERWIWLHVAGFDGAPDAWLDAALGRVKLGRWTSPWVANGAISLDGRRHRLGGLAARGLRVAEAPEGCTVRLPGERGVAVDVRLQVPAETAAGWRYADPSSEGSLHDVLNCSIAAVDLSVEGLGAESLRSLHSAHGGAFELGMRERSHGVPIAPFPDG